QQVKEQLAERSARREGLAGLALVGHASPTSVRASAGPVRLVERRGPGNVCISNLGEFEFPERALGLRVRAAHWTAPLSVTGYFLCAVCTTACGLSLDFSYITGIVSEARAERIVEGMLRHLARTTQQLEAARSTVASPVEVGS
ncbi:MAG TPA: hypothetical protein VJR89_35730, partial [Polyangiales bacterium]|nr:hypothetical protein [Polyangiales bacterium]